MWTNGLHGDRNEKQVNSLDLKLLHSIRRVYNNDTVSVRPSVCLSHLASQPRRAAGLLLWARRAGDIDRLLHGASAAGTVAFRSTSTAARPSAANAGSVTFTAMYEAENRLVY